MTKGKYEISIKDSEGKQIEVTPFNVFSPEDVETEPVITLMQLRKEYEEKQKKLITDFITDKYKKIFSASTLSQNDLYEAILVLSNFHREILKDKN